MSKIRTLVAHNNEEIRKTIVDSISTLDYVQVIATAKDGIETYNKIIDLKPEVVFSEYNYSNMSGLELMRKTKEKLQDKFPIFNTIGQIPENELKEAISITGDKLNAFVRQPYDGRVVEIIKAYKEDNK